MAFTKIAHTEYGQPSGVVTVTLSKPTGTADGDLMFSYIKHGAGFTEQANSVPSGWTMAVSRYENGSGSNHSVYWKIASGEGSSYVWAFPSLARNGAIMITYRDGFNSSNVIDVVSNTAYTTADTILRAASMSVTAVNSPIIFFGGVHKSASAYTFTPPTTPVTFTEDVDRWDGGSRAAMTIASVVWSGSGATGNMDATISASDAAKVGLAIALNPSSSTRRRVMVTT